ncbi:hypothetical protein MTO96_002478 [Rhipicephalus appendiculatus]
MESAPHQEHTHEAHTQGDEHRSTKQKRKHHKSRSGKQLDSHAGGMASVSRSNVGEATADTDLKSKTTSPSSSQQADSPQPQEEPPDVQTPPLENRAPSPLATCPIRPSAVVILAACVVALFAISLSVMVFRLFRQTVEKNCTHPACRELLGYMEAIVDKNVKPCNDFYRHVCDHWLQRETTAQGLATLATAPPGVFLHGGRACKTTPPGGTAT